MGETIDREHGTDQLPPTDVLHGHIKGQIAALEELQDFFSDAYTFVSDTAQVNDALTAMQRPDLGIYNPAMMKMFPSVDDFLASSNNFSPGFSSTIAQEINHDERRVVTADELRIIINGDLDTTGEYSALYHWKKPFMQRLFLLYPDFTYGLVVDRSDVRIPRRPERFYAAYSLAALLVDRSDRGVLRDGEVNDRYLCT
jgi:hypothetical protein